jgi:sugar/nucleoside kinase (ribokinase family)
MWQIQANPFVAFPPSPEIQIDAVVRNLKEAADSRRLTLVVGNGPTQNAVYEAQKLGKASVDSIGWLDAVRAVYRRTLKKEPPPSANSLVLAEAALRGLGNRASLVANIEKAVAELPPSELHFRLAAANPSAIITTNYDHLLERALDQAGASWHCYVRDGWWKEGSKGSSVALFKMHGSFAPPPGWEDRYSFPTSPPDAYGSIVLAEGDYDACTLELMRDKEASMKASPFWDALRQTILIVGKGVTWEDLSFMYALRRRRTLVPSMGEAYWLLPSLSAVEAVTLENLGIHPIVINMPRQPAPGNFYFGLARAVDALFPHLQAREFDGALMRDKEDLVGPPRIVAIGLCAHNTAGHVRIDDQDDQLPVPGRKNHQFVKAEEYAGGAALTAIGVAAALVKSLNAGTVQAESPTRCALVSAVGRDIFRQQVRDFCKDLRIDDDAVVEMDDEDAHTWRSTILVHTFRHKETGTAFGGQRVFLDRSFEKEAKFDRMGQRQFHAMLDDTNQSLRVVYLDKWLAHPGGDGSRQAPGFLAHDSNRERLRQVARRPAVDILYESGGTGSKGAVVEDSLADFVNVFTAGFPFFARAVLGAADSTPLPPALEPFRDSKGSQLDFYAESQAVTAALELMGDPGSWVPLDSQWARNAARFVKRAHARRWFVTTLHDRGALAFDLSSDPPVCRFFPAHPTLDQVSVANTAGAGDTFRGAFCFALSQLVDGDQRANLERCVRLGVRCATERCRVFSMKTALQNLRTNGRDWWHEASGA